MGVPCHRAINLLNDLFPLASLVNLTVISLQRLHATFCPFRHRFVKKWIYGVTIASIWLLATSLDIILYTVLSYLEVEKYRFVQNSTYVAIMFVNLSVCYLYFVRFHFYQSSMQPKSSTPWYNQQRKKTDHWTTTLIWVTFASLFSW